MANVSQLLKYFEATDSVAPGMRKVGTEIETFFVDARGDAMSIERSQFTMGMLTAWGWKVAATKDCKITELAANGNRILYELGYPNIELAVAPQARGMLIAEARSMLEVLYACADRSNSFPFFEPVFKREGNYLALPDDRDASWLQLDGKKALSPLARISAVQFTVDVSPEDAVEKLNRLNAAREMFLSDYPQDAVWREYVHSSEAGYLSDRFGGPSRFVSLEDYCAKLAEHAVVDGTRLVPFADATLQSDEDITLFLRSVWWYFRLRRYGRKLCIEVRPLPRRSDTLLQKQLDMVMDIIG